VASHCIQQTHTAFKQTRHTASNGHHSHLYLLAIRQKKEALPFIRLPVKAIFNFSKSTIFLFQSQLVNNNSFSYLCGSVHHQSILLNNQRDAALSKSNGQSSPVTGLEWPRGFQEVKVPRFHDNGTGWW
jgi:hypothetical protein